MGISTAQSGERMIELGTVPMQNGNIEDRGPVAGADRRRRIGLLWLGGVEAPGADDPSSLPSELA